MPAMKLCKLLVPRPRWHINMHKIMHKTSIISNQAPSFYDGLNVNNYACTVMSSEAIYYHTIDQICSLQVKRSNRMA